MKRNAVLLSIAVAALASSAAADVLTLAPAKDNTLYEDPGGALSNGAGDGLFAGVTATGALRRTVLQFDVAGALPAGATVNSVSLTMQVSMTIAGAVPMSLHTLGQDWGEGTSVASGMQGMGAPSATGDATWIHAYYTSVVWASAGGDFNSLASGGTAVSSGAAVFSSAQMAADVQDWLDNPGTNFGWLLKADDEVSSPSAKRFVSRESAFPGDRPALMIDFDPPLTGTTYCNSLPNITGSEAMLTATGDPNSSLVFTSTPVPDTTGQFFYGPMMLAGGTGLGDGLRCVGGMTTRILPFVNAGMMMQLPNTATIAVNYTAPYAAGLTGTQYFQHWFRSGTSAGTGSNASSGLEITF